MAAETIKDLALRIDVEAGSFLFMKRAERGEVGAGAFEREVRANDINDITGRADLFEITRGARGDPRDITAGSILYV
jgi:hypothetical protein